MSKLLDEISEQLDSAGASLNNGYESLMYGGVVRRVTKIQNLALEIEAERNAYKALLEAIIKHSSAEDIIKKQCQDALDRFEK